MVASPSWAPTPEQVADFVPGRTLVGAVDGYGQPRATFDDSTHPTGAQVLRLIDRAVSWVQTAAGDIPTDKPVLLAAATSTAACWTAGMVELSYPDNSRDLNTAQVLLDQAATMRKDLVNAIQVQTGTDPDSPASTLLPVYSFPDPVPWGDTYL